MHFVSTSIVPGAIAPDQVIQNYYFPFAGNPYGYEQAAYIQSIYHNGRCDTSTPTQWLYKQSIYYN